MNIFAPSCRPLRRTTLLLAGLVAAHAAPPALADTVPDPTRPMAAWLGDPVDVRPAKALRGGASVPTTTAAAAAASAVPATPRLQSVRLAAEPAESTALLDGRLVRLGDRVGERIVVAIDRHGITLRGPGGEQRLSLLAGISQTASREAPPAADTLATGTLQDKKP